MPATHSRFGFTLIELSIVLVIIGLLAAGILVGKDLMRAAEVRAVVSQTEKLNTAVYTFKLKLDCMPGDCTDPQTIGLPASTDPGNGNGVINGGDYGGVYEVITPETLNFWLALSFMNLIEGRYQGWAVLSVPPYDAVPGLASPAVKLKGLKSNTGSAGGFWVFSLESQVTTQRMFTNPSRHVWWLTNSMYKSSYVDTNGTTIDGRIYVAPDIYSIDSKLDDGQPWNGRVQAVSGPLNNPDANRVSAGMTDACVDDSNPAAPIYNFKSTGPTSTSLCSVLIETAF
jgi:prepilin-type N-terminal cleavage/methylation domain-containing protein